MRGTEYQSTGSSLGSLFKKSSPRKPENDNMTFEETTKTFVVDDNEQWLKFRRELHEKNIITNVGVQEHLVKFLQNLLDEYDQITTDNAQLVNRPNPKPQSSRTERQRQRQNGFQKRLRKLKVSAKNKIEKACAGTFFCQKEEEEEQQQQQQQHGMADVIAEKSKMESKSSLEDLCISNKRSLLKSTFETTTTTSNKPNQNGIKDLIKICGLGFLNPKTAGNQSGTEYIRRRTVSMSADAYYTENGVMGSQQPHHPTSDNYSVACNSNTKMLDEMIIEDEDDFFSSLRKKNGSSNLIPAREIYPSYVMLREKNHFKKTSLQDQKISNRNRVGHNAKAA